MPDYVKFLLENGRIIQKWISADPSIVENLTNILQVTRSEAETLTKFHIVDNGQVRLMTPAEQDALLAEEAQTQKQSLLEAIDKYEISNLDLLTALVKRINVRIPNNPITKQEIVSQIKLDLGLV